MIFHFRTNIAKGTKDIEIIHIDEVPPYLELSSLKVQEKSRFNLTRFVLNGEDPDTDPEKLTFAIKGGLKHGQIQLLKNGTFHDTEVRPFNK